MLIVINFHVDADIIEAPDYIVKDLKIYQHQFDQWLYNKSTNHSYWTYRNGEKFGCCYRAEAFVEWLNLFPLNNSTQKASIKNCKITSYNPSLPRLDF